MKAERVKADVILKVQIETAKRWLKPEVLSVEQLNYAVSERDESYM